MLSALISIVFELILVDCNGRFVIIGPRVGYSTKEQSKEDLGLRTVLAIMRYFKVVIYAYRWLIIGLGEPELIPELEWISEIIGTVL